MPEAHEQLHELEEGAEHALHSNMAPVSLTMAVLAVLVAVVTLLGHRAHTEEVVLQGRVTDEWAYFQAKNMRRDTYQAFLDSLTVAPRADAEAVQKLKERYEVGLERERDRQQEIQNEARKLEAEIAVERRRANRFDLAEGLLEAALVVTSITLLTRRRTFWYGGFVFAAAGIALAVLGALVH